MKFGDIVINEWAGDSNPEKVLMVVHHGKDVKCLSLKGSEGIYKGGKDLRLTKVGEIDFTQWKDMAKEILARVPDHK